LKFFLRDRAMSPQHYFRDVSPQHCFRDRAVSPDYKFFHVPLTLSIKAKENSKKEKEKKTKIITIDGFFSFSLFK